MPIPDWLDRNNVKNHFSAWLQNAQRRHRVYCVAFEEADEMDHARAWITSQTAPVRFVGLDLSNDKSYFPEHVLSDLAELLGVNSTGYAFHDEKARLEALFETQRLVPCTSQAMGNHIQSGRDVTVTGNTQVNHNYPLTLESFMQGYREHLTAEFLKDYATLAPTTGICLAFRGAFERLRGYNSFRDELGRWLGGFIRGCGRVAGALVCILSESQFPNGIDRESREVVTPKTVSKGAATPEAQQLYGDDRLARAFLGGLFGGEEQVEYMTFHTKLKLVCLEMEAGE